MDYICTTAERFFAVGRVLGNMVQSLVEQPSPRLLKHIIRCYLRLSDNQRLVLAQNKLPSEMILHILSCSLLFFVMLDTCVLPRACAALGSCLPDSLRDGTFSSCLRVSCTTKILNLFVCERWFIKNLGMFHSFQEDQIARRWLQQLVHNVGVGRVPTHQGGGFDHML